MTLETLLDSMLPAIENKLQQIVNQLQEPGTRPFREMLSYHMGWSGNGNNPDAPGKRIRPILVLLTCAACGADWHPALPAAVCIELIHNFSLAHDDIQDGSEMRRGRLAVWKKWSMAQAINVGDALFIMAHQALLESRDIFDPNIVVKVAEIVENACLALSCGQFLDIEFEKQSNLSLEEYWRMISGKTATLISACTQVGALLGGANEPMQENYRSFGHNLGLAFQVQDDYLGIWGDSSFTGKSTKSDLMTGKKTLPVIYGLEKNGSFAKRWNQSRIPPEEVNKLSDLLEEDGARIYTLEASKKMTNLALQNLRAAKPKGDAGEALIKLADNLLNRQV